MKKPRTSGGSEAERWTDKTGGEGGAEARLAALMRAGEAPRGLAPDARVRIWSRLRAVGRPTRTLGALRGSVAAGVLFASAGVVAAVTARRWREARPASVLAAPRADEHAPRVRHGVGPLAAATPAPDDLALPIAATSPRAPGPAPAPSPPLVLPPAAATSPRAPGSAPAPSPPLVLPPAAALPGAGAFPPSGSTARSRSAPRGPRPETEPSPPPVTAEAALAPVTPEAVPAPTLPATKAVSPPSPVADAPPPSALALEAPLLGDALTRLRQRHDARGALATLDDYDARFPRGTMHREAALARVDALLQLGRQDEALAVLQTLALQPRAREQELRVIRGELSAPASCAAAISDFDRVLAEAPAPALVERALHGRAVCRARLGDAAAATRDLREYLRRFPDGRFAAEARQSVGENNL